MVIIDCDFLSSFLKIDRIDLVRNFYQVSEIYTTPAVITELSKTPLINRLPEWLKIQVHHPQAKHDKRVDLEFERLGLGEQSCILLAKENRDSRLLISDNRARTVAQKEGLKAVNIPAFLLACKESGFLDLMDIQEIMDRLYEKNHYKFSQRQKTILLES